MNININTDWEWYENTNVFRLFYHCLLHTNLEDKRYCGRDIKAGQFVSSITRISAETGLTESQVRTALKKLKETGYISTISTNKYTIYTVNEYEKYIDCGQKATTEKNTEVAENPKTEEKELKPIKKQEETSQKSEKSKENSKKEINECFERLWKQYPNKRGKGQVSDAKKKNLYKAGEEHIQRALQRYLDGLEKDASWRKPQNGSTFFNSGYVDYLDENYEKPPEPKPQRNPASVLDCERDYDFEKLEQQILQQQFEGDYFNESY